MLKQHATTLLLTIACALVCADTANAYLHPREGRFMQRDPLGYPDGANLYAAYHVMWGLVDPSGRAPDKNRHGLTMPGSGGGVGGFGPVRTPQFRPPGRPGVGGRGAPRPSGQHGRGPNHPLPNSRPAPPPPIAPGAGGSPWLETIGWQGPAIVGVSIWSLWGVEPPLLLPPVVQQPIDPANNPNGPPHRGIMMFDADCNPCPSTSSSGSGQEPPNEPPTDFADPYGDGGPWESFEDATGSAAFGDKIVGEHVIGKTKDPVMLANGFTQKIKGFGDTTGAEYTAFKNPRTGEYAAGKGLKIE